MINKNYTFKIPCDEPACNATGTMEYDRENSYGVYAVQHECWECDGRGYHQTFEDQYSNETELKEDYSDAYDIEQMNGRYHRQSLNAREIA
jgi:DnaJ-class molecular chaperone